MSIIRKLITAIRGGANDAGEAIVDSQAIRILDQEIREAENDFSKAVSSLTEMEVHLAGLNRKTKELTGQVAAYEQHGTNAIKMGNQALAEDVAEKIVALEHQLRELAPFIKQGEADTSALKEELKENRNAIEALIRERDAVKAQEELQRAQQSISKSTAGTSSALTRARKTLERKKTDQRKVADRLEANRRLSSEIYGTTGNGQLLIDAKIEAAGVKGQGSAKEDVMKRLKAAKADDGKEQVAAWESDSGRDPSPSMGGGGSVGGGSFDGGSGSSSSSSASGSSD